MIIYQNGEVMDKVFKELMKKQLSLLNLKEMKFDLLLNVFMMKVIELLVIIKVSMMLVHLLMTIKF